MTLGWAVVVIATGLLAWLLPARGQLVQPLLLMHVLVGAVTAVALGVYLRRHLAATRDRRRAASRRSGWAVAGLGALVLVAGALTAIPRDLLGSHLHPMAHQVARYAHATFAFVGVVLLWLHRFTAPRDRLPVREVAALLGVLALVTAALAWAGRARPVVATAQVREQSVLRVPAQPASVEVLAETERCAECHADIVAQWNGSAHRFASFANPFYLHALQTLEKARGREVTRFCAGCHDPLPLMAGVFEGAAPLSAALPLADRGVTCLVCHTTFHARDPRGNGAIETAVRAPLWPPWWPRLGVARGLPAPEGAMSGWLTRVAPRAHVARLSSPVLRTAAFCGACHKVGLPASLTGWRFVRGFNDLDPWQQSSFSHAVALPFGVADEKSCAACHMKRVPSRDLAARDHQVLDHRFAAANTALAAHVGDERWLAREIEMLREAKAEAVPLGMAAGGALATPLDGGTVPAATELTLHVLVTAPGVGHQFPGGTLDSHETWVELEVRNRSGEVIARHGGVAEDGGPRDGADDGARGGARDEAGGGARDEAHRLRARPIDAEGEAIVERDAFRTRTVLYNHTATAGAGELVRYRLSARPEGRRADHRDAPVVPQVRARVRGRGLFASGHRGAAAAARAAGRAQGRAHRR